MRLALISDLHSNLEALEAVLAHIDSQGADSIGCLGDVVGYGPDPEACVDLVLVDLSGGGSRRRLQRRLPPDLEQALAILRAGPPGADVHP